MRTRNIIALLKNDGYKVVVFYFVFNLFVDLISHLLPGSDITLQTGSPLSLNLVIAGILSIVIATFSTAAAIGSFDDLVNNKMATLNSFMSNGRRFFLGTLGYGIIYGIPIALATIIPLLLVVFLFFGFANSSAISVLTEIVVGIAIEGFALPYIVLNVLKKSTKGFVRENYRLLLASGIIAALLLHIPLVGKYMVLLFNSIYYLLILTLQNDRNSSLYK